MQERRNRVITWSSRVKPSEAPAQDQSPAGREPQDARFWNRYDCLGARVNSTAFHLQSRVEHLNHTFIIHKLSPAEHRITIRSWRSAIGVARVESQVERNTWIEAIVVPQDQLSVSACLDRLQIGRTSGRARG